MAGQSPSPKVSHVIIEVHIAKYLIILLSYLATSFVLAMGNLSNVAMLLSLIY